jgi:purine-binding chemotaxis protein CheW
MASIQICTFTLDRYLFGVDVRQIQEVLRTQPMTRVPLAPSLVRGLINLRGQIVTAFDLRERLGLPKRGPGAEPMNVVLRRDDGAVALLVDDIGDVVEIDESRLERPPHSLRGPAADLVRSVVQMPGALLCVMDTERATGTGTD